MKVIPSSFHFVKMCLCKVRAALDIWLLLPGAVVYCLYGRGGRHVSFYVVNVTLANLDPLAFVLHFLSQYWIAARLICSFCEAMAGSLSVASAAAVSAKVAVADYGEVGRCAVHGRYNNDPRTLPWCKPALTGESSMYWASTSTRKCLLCKYDFRTRK
jgi:hypothetical protein